jgi:ribonuclease P protein component
VPDDSSLKRFSFPKSRRILHRRDFVRVQGQGFKVSTECALALVCALEDSQVPSRIGLTVSKKVGNAVVRSTVRRRCREAFRTCQNFPSGFEVVLIAKSAAVTAAFPVFVRSVNTVASALRLRLRKRLP